jgi:hypothetical protein
MKQIKLAELYSQQDLRWKNVLLGTNTDLKYTIGNYGCLLTDVSVYLCAIGYKVNPLDLNNIIKSIGGFQNGGVFVFNSLFKKWPDVVIDYVSPRFDSAVTDAGINMMYTLLDQDKPLFTEVDFNPSTVMEEQHWVLIVGYDDNKNFICFDPWSGTVISLNVYGDARRAIYCYRTYGKPISSGDETMIIGKKVYADLIGKLDSQTQTITKLTNDYNALVALKDAECQNKLNGLKNDIKNRIIAYINSL